MPLVYAELRGIAERHFRRERAGHTLQPTAVVHEAYFRLVDQTRVTWKNRGHFFADRLPGDAADPGRPRARRARRTSGAAGSGG